MGSFMRSPGGVSASESARTPYSPDRKAEVEGLPYHGITPALIGPGDRDLLQVPSPSLRLR